MYDSFKLWQNYLFCCVDLLEISEGLNAMKRVFDLLDKKNQAAIDHEVLDIFIDCVLANLKDAEGIDASVHAKTLAHLLTHFHSKISNSIQLNRATAKFYEGTGDYSKALEFYLKDYRLALKQPFVQETGFKTLASSTLNLVDAYVRLGSMEVENRFGSVGLLCADKDYQISSILKTVIGRTKDWEDHEMYSLLLDKQAELCA